MFKHFILITSHSTLGCRIGWHKIIETPTECKHRKDIVKRITKETRVLKFTSHIITTNSVDITSIREKDAFFTDIIFFSDVDEFIDMFKIEEKYKYNDITNAVINRIT